MLKKILVIQELFPEQIEELKASAPEYEVIQNIEDADPATVEIILGWSNQLIPLIEAEDSAVKWIQFPYAGVNSLPLDLFAKKGIVLTNGSGIHARPVTETTVGLLLGLTRQIVVSARHQEKSEWAKPKSLYELSGKTMFIVGAGQIGVQLGRVAQAFDMRTVGINRSGRKIENMDEQYLQTDLPKVIGEADVVVNILPLTKETEHLYNSDLFSKMKDGVIFINVGRGESVATNDLLAALDTGKVSCAGLDVFEEEPLPADHPLWKHEKVLMTPHSAGAVENYSKYIFPLFMENFSAYKDGQELPKNIIKLDEGY